APWTAHYGGLVGQSYRGVLNYIEQRSNSVRNQFPARVPFAITTNGGQDFMVNSIAATLEGTCWIDVKRIVVEGRGEPIQFDWPTLTTWQATVPLILGNNHLTFLAYDFRGNPVSSNTVSVVSTAVGGGLDIDDDGIPDVWERENGLNS